MRERRIRMEVGGECELEKEKIKNKGGGCLPGSSQEIVCRNSKISINLRRHLAFKFSDPVRRLVPPDGSPCCSYCGTTERWATLREGSSYLVRVCSWILLHCEAAFKTPL